MGLLVKTQIGTDQGITDSLYIRIANYQINKQGSANFQLQLFMSKADATSQPGAMYMMGNTARNNAIGDSLNVPLTKEVSITRTGTRPASREVKHEVVTTIDGVSTTSETIGWEQYQEDYTWEEKTQVADLSPLVGVDIFTFAYGKLKEKLEGLFPGVEVVDC